MMYRESTFILLVLPIFPLLVSGHGESDSNECVYLLDMGRNHISVKCSESATITIVDKDGHSLVGGQVVGTSNDTHIFKLHRSKAFSQNHATKKSSKKLVNASRELRLIHKEYMIQMKALLNLTRILQGNENDLHRDLEMLRRHELESPLVREAIMEALQYQFNLLRVGFLRYNRQLTDIITLTMRLTTTAIKISRGAHGLGDSLDRRVDDMNENLFNITALMPGWD